MAVGNITRRILSDAKKEASQIVKEAEAETSKIVEEAKSLAQDKRKKLEEQMASELSLSENNKIVTAGLQARNAVLEEKHRLVDEVFKKAFSTLLKLDKQKYALLMEGMIKTAASPDDELILSPKDLPLGEQVLSQVNQDGKKLILSEETRDIAGGFILRKGGIETNYSFEAIILNLREQLEVEVTKTLFTDGLS